MNYANNVRVLSFGAGTQSSALLALIENGELPPVDFAVFADTQCEPDEVYAWLEKIKTWAKTKIIIATKGNLLMDALECASGKGKRFSSIPFHTKNIEELYGNGKGKMKRQCTFDYKIAVVQKSIRDELGYKPRQHVKHKIEMLIAMSREETGRMRDSRIKWIKNVYPLIYEKGWYRQQAIDYMKMQGLGEPPRSSCLMCPFHGDEEWKRLKENEPHNFEKAVQFDKACRKLPRLNSETYLHKSLKPLDEIDFTEPQKDIIDLFQNECQGMCGV